jgi:sugar lactone lactonase YvrE
MSIPVTVMEIFDIPHARFARCVLSNAGGMHCIDPDCRLLGEILAPYRVSNLTFGDPSTGGLFVGGSHAPVTILPNRLAGRRQ